MDSEDVPLRDQLIYALSQPPFSLSIRSITKLLVTDFTPDDGASYHPELVLGTYRIPLPRDFVTNLDRYLFQHGQCGAPFLDWRPDIPPYVFQSAKSYTQDQPLSRGSVGEIVASMRPPRDGGDDDENIMVHSPH